MESSRQQIKHLFKSNILKTIWFNWKMLPARQAWKLPIYLYGKTRFRSLAGRIVIEGPVFSGMIKVGKNDYYVSTSVPRTIWTINGEVRFKGPANFMMGSYITVAKGAHLSFGKMRSVFGSNIRIMCFEKITVGGACQIAWDCQLIDTSFHYIEDMETGEVAPLTKPVLVGDNVWIGNRVTLSKGCIVPDNTIIASNSLVNKDFSSCSPHTMLAGVPARVKKEGIARIWSLKREREYDNLLGYDRTHL